MAVIDTLKLARALRDQAGFTQNAADATAEALNAALGVDVATKTDIETTRTGLKADIDGVRAEIQATKVELRGDIRLLQWQIAIMYALQIVIIVKLFVH
jgi:hypothetical protein